MKREFKLSNVDLNELDTRTRNLLNLLSHYSICRKSITLSSDKIDEILEYIDDLNIQINELQDKVDELEADNG